MITPNDIAIEIYGMLNGVVSDNVYDQNAPRNIPVNAKDFVVFEVGYVRPAYDYDEGVAYRSYATIVLYAKDKPNGIKNTMKLKNMTDSLIGAVKNNTKLRMSLSTINVMPVKYDDFHGQSIIYNIYKKDTL